MSGATEVSRSERFFLIELRTPSIIFENDTEEGAANERQWHDDQHERLSSRIMQYIPKIRAELDSIIKSDNDRFGIIEYSSDIKYAPYNIDEMVANANRPYRYVALPAEEHSHDNEHEEFCLRIATDEKVYLDGTDDISGDDVMFEPGVTGPYRYEFRLSERGGSGYANDYFTYVTVALRLGIPAGLRAELAARLSDSIRADNIQ